MGLESRLQSAHTAISDITEYQLTHKARLTFRGKPVFGSHGIAADFATKAAGAFTDAVAAIAAGLAEDMRYMGPIPDKQKNQLLITGTAIGSFGFEFELPQDPRGKLFPEASNAENALDKVQELFRLASEGNDDEISELVAEIHPRAVKKAADFLDYISQQEAWCGLEFKERSFKFQGIEQLKASAARLREDNIHEKEATYQGELQGVLPASRNFEFKPYEQQLIIKGKVGHEIVDADVLNRDFLHKPVSILLHVIQVGQGRPRYTLQSLPTLTNVDGSNNGRQSPYGGMKGGGSGKSDSIIPMDTTAEDSDDEFLVP
jgi:hypothetical protein